MEGNTIMELFRQYENYIYLFCGATVIFLFGKLGSLRSVADSIYGEFKALIGWLARALSENDGNGGKPSFTKILGTYVVLNIVSLALMAKPIAPELMTLFLFLIGYSIISKVLLENPALMELIKGKYGIASTKKEGE